MNRGGSYHGATRRAAETPQASIAYIAHPKGLSGKHPAKGQVTNLDPKSGQSLGVKTRDDRYMVFPKVRFQGSPLS